MRNTALLICIVCLLYSCKNNPYKKQEELMRRFDSINKSLDSIDKSFGKIDSRETFQRIEDLKMELELLSHKDGEMRSRIHELREANESFQYFTDSLKDEFTHFCGVDENGQLSPDKEADFSLTNRFFIERKNGRFLYKNIMSFAKAVQPVLLTDTTRDQLAQMTHLPLQAAKASDPYAIFEKILFENTPPVAALTILAKYQDDASAIRSTILREYYHKHVSSQKF